MQHHSDFDMLHSQPRQLQNQNLQEQAASAVTEQPTTLSQKSRQLLDQFVASVESDRNLEIIPCSAIDNLEREIEHLNAVIAHISAKVTQVRKRRNKLVPINTIFSKEILSYIFQAGAREDIDNTAAPFPHFSATASHVCQLWRSVALTTPALWSLFSYMTPTELTRRARGIPLDLVIHLDIFTPIALSNIAATKFPRACSIRIVVPCSPLAETFDTSWLAGAPAPCLSKFLITTTEARPRTVPRFELPSCPFRGQYPSLREISITSTVIPWDTPLLSGLQVLWLDGIEGLDCSVDVITLISILQSCPKLETLLLYEAGPKAASDSAMIPTAFLPALRSLTWINERFAASFQLLNHIVIPRIATITLSTLFFGRNISHRNDGDIPAGFGTLLQVVLSSCRELKLLAYTYRSRAGTFGDFKTDCIDYDTEDNRVNFSLIRDDGKIENVMDVIRLHSPVQIQSIILHNIEASASESLVRLLRALPNVEAISFTDCRCQAHLVSALSEESWLHTVRDVSFTRSRIPAEAIISFARSRPLNSLRRLSFHACGVITLATVEMLKSYVLEVVIT
ncbi:hypothetical protein BOTBODRAFT_54083 [Botryobasidium botryosum FD-172 SS1]|uniref:Uncharacterized protein n=1 Tax=Botryobasidium botryosum (strain FD-172 SS1) TaxID=930990 RepID=A0A067MXL5_BOTB1|nr:hypothetical protein BOTBODRAFT_54083 [Botryobasidium botryosum FD-172 SS1]